LILFQVGVRQQLRENDGGDKSNQCTL
jgi:hypothetical protein